jgi:AcrR family transcriptional regulator
VENLVSTLADRSLADRHETYATEIRDLLDAALDVRRREETIDPRVSDIVRSAGLSNQAFYRHFRGKAELLVALLDDGRQRLLATIERNMARADGDSDRVRAWIEVVLAQARDPEAAAATRPFAINGDRLAVEFPDETRRSRDRLVDPLRAIVGEPDALAVYHLAM